MARLTLDELCERFPQYAREILDLFGVVGAQEYDQSLDGFKDQLKKDIVVLRELSDAQFIERTAYFIWDSASMNRFRGMDHVHARASAAFHQSSQRYFERDGHDADCRGTHLYGHAYNIAVTDAGHASMARDIAPCSCGKGGV